MARPFLDETLNPDPSYGSAFGEAYDVITQVTAGSNSAPPSEHSKLVHPFPLTRLSLNFENRKRQFTQDEILDLYHKAGGTHGAFRVHHHSDYSSNSYTGTPTAADQVLELSVNDPAANKFQLTRWYGTQGDPTATRRRILKPVAGSIKIGIRDAGGSDHELTQGYTASATTGEVVYTENSQAITGITKGATTSIEVGSGHGYSVGDSVTFREIAGTTELNGQRATVSDTTSTIIVVDIDSSAFGDYTSGGNVHQAPQPDEHATAGFQFDLPMRFETELADITYSNWDIMGATISLVEVRNL